MILRLPKCRAFGSTRPWAARRKSGVWFANEGVTLLELTLAVAIFAIAVGAAAQTLISFYVTMDMQNQRVVAVNHCRAVLSNMRNLRDAFPNSATTPNNFQNAVLAAYAPEVETDGPAGLTSGKVVVSYEDANPSTNPLVPTVMVQWHDLRGRTCTVSLSSAISDR
jgi:prepilin-type N-terminal cleavage/methylation domain-containing protein